MNNVDTVKEHFDWIDWAKIIGIFLVTLGHGSLVNEEIRTFIYSFHMPLFFILSGMLWKQRSLMDSIKRGWRTLMIPYLIINFILLIVVSFLLYYRNLFSIESFIARLVPIFLGLGYNTETYFPVSTPLWFIIALFIIQALMAIGRGKIYHLFLALVSVFSFCLLQHLKIDTLIPIDSAFLALPFFYIGHRLKSFFYKTISPFITILLFYILIIINYYNGRVDIDLCETGKSLILLYISGLIGSIIVFQFSRIFKGGVQISEFASGTMLIMGFNLYVIGIAKTCWNILPLPIPLNSFIGVVLAISICIIFIPIIRVCRKYFKAILGYR